MPPAIVGPRQGFTENPQTPYTHKNLKALIPVQIWKYFGKKYDFCSQCKSQRTGNAPMGTHQSHFPILISIPISELWVSAGTRYWPSTDWHPYITHRLCTSFYWWNESICFPFPRHTHYILKMVESCQCLSVILHFPTYCSISSMMLHTHIYT